MANFLVVEVEDMYTAFKPISDEQLVRFTPFIQRIQDCVEYENFPYMGHDYCDVYDLYSGDDLSIDTLLEFLEFLPTTPDGFEHISKVELVDVGHITCLLSR